MASPDSLERQAKLEAGPLLPLLPPKPLTRLLPPLPPRPANVTPIHAGWTCERHVFPAAFPRSYANSTKRPDEPKTNPAEPAPGAKRANPKEALTKLLQPQLDGFRRHVRLDDEAELARQEQLLIAANRYRPERQRTDDGPGLTLVFSHANGFYKEVWEPALSSVLAQLEANGRSLPVDEIWALDCINQGDSAVLNDDVLGNVFNWADHGRDLLNFVINYVDSPSSDVANSDLSKPASDVSADLLQLDNAPVLPPGPPSPASRTYRKKLIVAIGHSLGGGATAYAASACPSIFSSVIFVDPVLPRPSYEGRSMEALTTGALMRREKWKSRQEALDGFLKKPFFTVWDRRVLDGYVDYGMKEVEDGVALKCTARSEALIFMDPMAVASRRACARLSLIPPSLPAHFIFADEGRSVLQEDWIEYIQKEAIPHSSASRVEAGHLVVHEKPDETASRIVDFLEKTYPRQKRARL
ncbi:hypothetical protein JCM10296v2_004221 [Rhodotorula toruloides]